MNTCSSARTTPRVASRPPLAKKNIQVAKNATPKTSNASYAMLARRRARPGVTSVLLAARVGRVGRDEALPLVRRQRLVFRPGLAQVLFRRLARRLGELLVILACLAALLGREVCPSPHAPLHALLLDHLHARVALGDRDPLQAAI